MVCLKDFKMPETCEECTLESYCSLWVDARRMSDDGKKAKIRHPDCPLILVPDHGRLIDADEFLKRAIGTKCFRGDYALMLEELVGESTTIIPGEVTEDV